MGLVDHRPGVEQRPVATAVPREMNAIEDVTKARSGAPGRRDVAAIALTRYGLSGLFSSS